MPFWASFFSLNVIKAKPFDVLFVLSSAKKMRLTRPNGTNKSRKSSSWVSSGKFVTRTVASSEWEKRIPSRFGKEKGNGNLVFSDHYFFPMNKDYLILDSLFDWKCFFHWNVVLVQWPFFLTLICLLILHLLLMMKNFHFLFHLLIQQSIEDCL